MADNRNFLLRLFHIESGISLGQWAYDRIANNWQSLVAIFVGLGGMSYLASISQAIAEVGPVAIGGIGLFSALTIWIVLAWAQYLRAKAQERQSIAAATEKWKEQVDAVNPLDREFNKKRLSIVDLAHPVTKRVSGKRFIDCQLMGSANIVFSGKNILNLDAFGNCDVIVMNPNHKVPINNVVLFEDLEIIGGEILNCTLFIQPSLIPIFRKSGAPFVSFTGDPQIDNLSPPSTELETQP